MTLIELKGVSKTFAASRKGGEPVHAVRDVDLSVEAGEIVGIVGYSGAGKSTLVRLVNALEPTTSGSLVVDGTDLTTLPERQLQKVRLEIGMIFQQFNLLQSRTVWGNIAYPLEVAKIPKAEHQRRISDLLNFVGLADKAHAWPEELSGGQKQRVGVARALATSPKILLADEATSALDPETTVEVLRLLKRVNTELGITIMVITHEMDVVKTIADRVVVMEQGRIVEQGPVFDIFSRPQHLHAGRRRPGRGRPGGAAAQPHRPAPDAVVQGRVGQPVGRLRRDHRPGRRVRARLRRDRGRPGSGVRAPHAGAAR
jgi:D-methionine transport system ATP-binding protein